VTEPHKWFELDMGIGDTRMPFRLSVDLDGWTVIQVGRADVQGVYETVCDVEELNELIVALCMVRNAAQESRDG
jgi:hypothetical protein